MRRGGFWCVLALAVNLLLSRPCDVSAAKQGTTVYFVVANPGAPEQGAYVLPLTEPDDVAHARAVIASPDTTESQIVTARIAAGASDGAYINCDPLNGGRSWSWHVTEFLGFADFTAEIYDGWAEYVEVNFEEWMLNTGGQIGFWNYRVVSEFSGTCDDSGPVGCPACRVLPLSTSLLTHLGEILLGMLVFAGLVFQRPAN